MTASFSVAGGATLGTASTQSGAAAFTATSGPVTLGAGSFFFNDTAAPEIYTLSLHDALPILMLTAGTGYSVGTPGAATGTITNDDTDVSVAVSPATISEDHTTKLH